MKRMWIAAVLLSFMILGCGPSAHIQKGYIQIDQQKTGPIEVFTSFDDVGKPHKKVAELEIVDQREPNTKIRDRMIESLKAKAGKLGADCIVIVEEGTSISTTPNPFGGEGVITFYGYFIKSTAIVFE